MHFPRSLIYVAAFATLVLAPVYARADATSDAVKLMEDYLAFADYGGATIFPEQIPKEDWPRFHVIDARDKKQFDKEHIPGAVNLEWRQALEKRATIPKDKSVLIYCNTMGDPDHPVNVWQWRADGRMENLVAHGFGTATRAPFEGLKGAATRTASGWAVVLTRTLKVKPDEGASLPGKGGMPIAFAVWDGQNQERDGLKAVTLEWWRLKF